MNVSNIGVIYLLIDTYTEINNYKRLVVFAI